MSKTSLNFLYSGYNANPETVLRPCDDLSIGIVNEKSHILIKGENLDALFHMSQIEDAAALLNSVDLCYIDPPYNTGNDASSGFTYADRFQKKGDKDRHAQWLSFMEDRLLALPSLLKNTGVVIISIDDSEVHRLRMLMDDIFGERNFIAQLVIDGGALKNNARFFSITHEYMLVYAKDLSALNKSGNKWRKEREGIDILLREYAKQKRIHGNDYAAISSHLKKWVKSEPLSKRLKVFYNTDARGLYTYADLSTPGNGPRYDVLHPITGKPCQVPSRGWGLSVDKLQALINDDMIIFGVDETFQPLKKLYLRNVKDQVQKAILEYPSRSSTHLLEKVLGRRSSFNNPKNLTMMMNLIDLICPEDGTVLDYFAGSGTTGHAVLALNEKMKTNRKFVLVTNNENNIFDDVTYPRLKIVIDKINNSNNFPIEKPTMQVLNVLTPKPGCYSPIK